MEFFLDEISEARGPRRFYAIVNEEGDDVGIIFLELLPGNSLYIRNIQVAPEINLGLPGVRALREAIKEEFPEARSIVGHRISGMRKRSRHQFTEVEI